MSSPVAEVLRWTSVGRRRRRNGCLRGEGRYRNGTNSVPIAPDKSVDKDEDPLPEELRPFVWVSKKVRVVGLKSGL